MVGKRKLEEEEEGREPWDADVRGGFKSWGGDENPSYGLLDWKGESKRRRKEVTVGKNEGQTRQTLHRARIGDGGRDTRKRYLLERLCLYLSIKELRLKGKRKI